MIFIGCKSVDRDLCFIACPEKIDSMEIHPGIDYDYFEFKVGPSPSRTFIKKYFGKEAFQDKIANSFDSIDVKTGFSNFSYL